MEQQRTCAICLEERPPESFLALCQANRKRREGEEPHACCRECTMAMVRLHLRDNSLESLRCPVGSCGLALPAEAVSPLLEEGQERERYHEQLLQRALRAMPDIRWCPRNGCSNPVIVSLKRRQGLCSECGYCFCIKCNNLSHFGACAKSLDVPRETLTWLAQATKQCPRCFIYIEKNGGCNHMKCTRCHLDFGWSDAKNTGIAPLGGVTHKRTWTKEPNQTTSMLALRYKPGVDDRVKTPNAPEAPALGFPLTGNPEVRIQGLSLIGSKAAEAVMLMERKRVAKRCPSCRQGVEKQTKCNQIHCANCHARFCFVCLSFLKKGTTLHFQPSGCPLHS